MADETPATEPAEDADPSWGPGAPSSDGQGGMRDAVEGAKALRDKLRKGGDSR